jgi:hypothetical protein
LIDQVRDIVGFDMDTPEHAVVLCVDEKSQIQALDRTAPLLPMRPGQLERRTHDYKRHGTMSLFAALDAKACAVIAETQPRHRSLEFRKFSIGSTPVCRRSSMCTWSSTTTGPIRRIQGRHKEFDYGAVVVGVPSRLSTPSMTIRSASRST